ncbi:hypothetical protein VSDG_06944 [Cytospora chrysosperma]|uniref:Uncharacterized protein n=1 Tax=Cytospora chrysosperma TaxID=252740 RepID=A0A423VRQ0_CYTCH|nr:hypothetical protein VSDG_06944 [Valsa sordida]
MCEHAFAEFYQAVGNPRRGHLAGAVRALEGLACTHVYGVEPNAAFAPSLRGPPPRPPNSGGTPNTRFYPAASRGNIDCVVGMQVLGHGLPLLWPAAIGGYRPDGVTKEALVTPADCEVLGVNEGMWPHDPMPLSPGQTDQVEDGLRKSWSLVTLPRF